MAITRGTTPTISYKFKIVNPADIVVAELTLSQTGAITITKHLSDATVETDRLVWRLTQEETLSFVAKQKSQSPPIKMQLRYRLNDGSAHATAITEWNAYPIMKDGEI